MIVYCITHNTSGKRYIGQTTQRLESRLQQHFKKTTKSCPALAAAIRKYGKEAFTVEILAEANSQEELNKLESLLIQQFNTVAPHGYNLEYGGSRGKDSKETIEKRKTAINQPDCLLKISNKSKENWSRPEYRKAISESRKEMWNNPEYRKKIQDTKTTEEAVARQRQIAYRTIVAAAKKKAKKVVAVHKDTGVETIYESATVAEMQGFKQSEISKCCNNPFKKYSHKNHYWRFVCEPEKQDN